MFWWVISRAPFDSFRQAATSDIPLPAPVTMATDDLASLLVAILDSERRRGEVT